MIQIRSATLKDQEGIRDIYNQAVVNTTATFDTGLRSTETQIAWFEKHGENHPVIIAEENEKVLGWASLSPWSDRCAYDTTVEISVYIHPDHQGKGLGKQLVASILEAGSKLNIHTVIARITEGNAASIHLHEKAGFTYVGTMKEVGFKFGKFLDVQMMQFMYPKS